MIKKVLFTLSIASILAATAQAQTVNPCGTDDVYRRQLAAHPEIAVREAQLSEEIANKLHHMDLSPYAKTTDDGTVEYDVPIVFHIIHDYNHFNTNVKGGDMWAKTSDDLVARCVDTINQMYNKQFADTLGIISPFRGFINNSNQRYIGNAHIKWHLATKDPDGNPTNGVTRRQSYLSNSAGDLAKYDQWPPQNYMNVWIITKMSDAHSSAAAYAYKPATGDVIPYYDGVIVDFNYMNSDNTISHELGHELNLDHPWGGTNNPEVACGDDDVDDTPTTKGHSPSGCSNLAAIYDTACLFNYNKSVGKLRLDSLKRADSPAYTIQIFSDTSTSKGIIFKNRTASTLNSFSFYPSDTIGSTYQIGLKRNNTLIDSVTVVTTVKNEAQAVSHVFKVPAADTSVNFKLFFMKNPGALRDTITPLLAGYPHGQNGSIVIKSDATDNYYNFFYDWKVTYGYFKIYGDSLVDYPDTTNSQNVMDYTYCSKMFTYGQVSRMRAALTSTVAKRSTLISPENLTRTGTTPGTPAPSLSPKSEYSVERGVTATGIQANDLSYFLCADNSAAAFSFVFQNRTWRANADNITWTLSNGATVGATSSSTTKVTTKFADVGWATVKINAANATGATDYESTQKVYVADPNAINPIGYWQEFGDASENERWPIFNYYNNRYKWEITNNGGTYDGTAIRYRSYDDRVFPESALGEPAGDYDDFFTPAFDLSKLGAVNGNLNFMYAGAYATNNPDLMKDVLEIAYSTSCGGNWTTLYTLKNTDLQTVGTIASKDGEYKPSWADWKPISIDLKSGTTTIRDSRVFFRFRYKPSSRPVGSSLYAAGNNFYLDRFNISDNPLTVNEMILGDKKAAVAPNPTRDNAFVLFQKPNAHVKIDVLDITGKLVYSVAQKIDQSNAKVEIPAAYLTVKGVYLVRITGDDNLNQTEKLIVY